MLQDRKDQIIKALEDATDEVANQGSHEHHKMLTAEAGALPSWLMNILKALGPALIQALQQWLNNQYPPREPGSDH